MADPKDNRIPIMMSDIEVAAIDDWGFQHRIRSRSEAVRRLCQIGMRAEAMFPDLIDKWMNTGLSRDRLIEKVREALASEDPQLDIYGIADAHRVLSEHEALHESLRELFVQTVPMATDPDFEAAMRKADERQAATEALKREIAERIDQG